MKHPSIHPDAIGRRRFAHSNTLMLARIEPVIARGLRKGASKKRLYLACCYLRDIRDFRLWYPEYESYRDYMDSVWGIVHGKAIKMIEWAERVTVPYKDNYIYKSTPWEKVARFLRSIPNEKYRQRILWHCYRYKCYGKRSVHYVLLRETRDELYGHIYGTKKWRNRPTGGLSTGVEGNSCNVQ